MEEIFTAPEEPQEAEPLFYEEVTSGEYTYLQLKEETFDSVSDIYVQSLFVGFSAVGAALIISLGAAVLIRMFKSL